MLLTLLLLWAKLVLALTAEEEARRRYRSMSRLRQLTRLHRVT